MVGRNTLDVAIEVRILEGEFFMRVINLYDENLDAKPCWFEREPAEAMWRKR